MSELLRRQLLFGSKVEELLAEARRRGFLYKLGEALRQPSQAQLNSLTKVQRIHVAALLKPEFPALARAILDITGARPGIAHSVHGDSCALDLLLFTDTEEPQYLTGATAYAELGAWWKAQDPLLCWGGDFGDADHFSITPDGVRK